MFFKKVPGYENYAVCDNGTVFNIKKGFKKLSLSENKTGSKQLKFFKDGKCIKSITINKLVKTLFKDNSIPMLYIELEEVQF